MPVVLAEVEIDDLGHDGRGVARLDGKTVFVAGALPGERVRVRIERRHARYDEARTCEVLRASAARRQPPCPYYARCGGCNLQHLDPSAQLEAHQRQLEQALQRIAKLRPHRWLDPVHSAPWGFRARARLAIAHDPASGAVHLGFRQQRSHRVEALGGCEVLEPALARLLRPLAETLSRLALRGSPREVWLASGDDGAAFAIGCATALPAGDRALLEALGRETGFALRIGTARAAGGYAWEEAPPALGYAPAEGLRLGFDPWDFTQANRAVNRALVSAVLHELAPRPHDRALELFCGLGNFSLPLARCVRELTGIDGDVTLAERARDNARANGCSNASFLVADLARPPEHASWARQHWDLVLLDPPRSGAAALCDTLGASGARCLVYVSCDAATLARDAARLAALGLGLDAAGVLAMFPQTSHFESLAVFRR